MQTLENLRFGIIGGSQGLGKWLVDFLRENKLTVVFTSGDAASECASNARLVELSDVIVLAVPVSAMLPVLDEIFPGLAGKTLIEVCSVKKFLIEHFNRLQAESPQIDCRFYSIHPMFSGQLTDLTGQVLLFTHSYQPDFVFTETFKQLFSDRKAIWHHIDYRYHDRVMGVVQGLNHFNVFVSAKTLLQTGISLDTVKNFSSPPYRIFLVFFTRYVLQNPGLYADIQMYNESVGEVLQIFRAEVEKLSGFIEQKDRTGFIEYIAEMQDFFRQNQSDRQLSTHLIEQLGKFLSEN
jgi:prephenate dehydrogenase